MVTDFGNGAKKTADDNHKADYNGGDQRNVYFLAD
jgi:hypothetical protein